MAHTQQLQGTFKGALKLEALGRVETETVVHYESQHQSNQYGLIIKELLRFTQAHRAPLTHLGVSFSWLHAAWAFKFSVSTRNPSILSTLQHKGHPSPVFPLASCTRRGHSSIQFTRNPSVLSTLQHTGTPSSLSPLTGCSRRGLGLNLTLLIIENSKSNHVSAQGTFDPSPFSLWMAARGVGVQVLPLVPERSEFTYCV